MGCTPSTQSLNNLIPPQYLKQYEKMANLDDPSNINKRYQHLMRVDRSNTNGSSYRKTFSYEALATKEEIEQKRKEFWETRNSGLPENWQAIKNAIYANRNSTGVCELQRKKIFLLNGSIQFCIDRQLNRYEVPIFCINQPTAFSEERLDDKNLSTDYEDRTIEIIVRPGSEPNGDLKINQISSSTIEIVKQTIKVLKQLQDDANIRLFYKGRQMKDDKTFGNYRFETGNIVQAIIS